MKTTTPLRLSSAILGETITYVAVVMSYAVFEFSSELFGLIHQKYHNLQAINVLLILLSVFGFWSLLTTKLQKYENIT